MSDIIYVRRNIKSMSITGLWEESSSSGKLLIKLFRTIPFAYLVLFNITEFIDMYYVMTDIRLFIQNAGVTFLVLMNVLKVYTVIYRKERIELLLEAVRAAEKISLQKTGEELKKYHESIDDNWFISKAYWKMIITSITGFFIARPLEYWFVGPQEENDYKIPLLFSSWFPFDKFSHYKLAYGLQALIGIIGPYYICVIDMFIISFMRFAIGQFEILQLSIKNLHTVRPQKDEFELMDVYPELVQIIKHHLIITDLLEDLDNFLKPIVFLNFCVCSLMICSVGFEGIMSGVSVRLGLSLEYLLAILIQLFIFYWHANELTLQSTYVGHAVAESEWYRFSLRVKKALLMVMIRAQKPCQFSIGGFNTVSLNTFLMILRAAYSYLALFRELYRK